MWAGNGVIEDGFNDPDGEGVLPDHLKKVLRDTNSALGDVLSPFVEAIAATPPPSTIYHYTDDIGLKGILQNGHLWLTDVFDLNDPSELKHGIGLSEVYFSELWGGEMVVDEFADTFAKIVNEGLENIANFFVCSFSREKDDLGQWRAYADDGRGYAIGFNAHSLEQAFAKTESADQWGCSAFPVTYDDEKLAGFQRQMIDIVLSHVRNAEAMKLNSDVSAAFLKGLAIRLALGCINAAVYFKHTAYKNEFEYRFLQLHRAEDAFDGIKFRSRPYRLVRYMEFGWQPVVADRLTEIICGPAGDPKQVKQFALDCLKAFLPSKSSIPIRISQIPYRNR